MAKNYRLLFRHIRHRRPLGEGGIGILVLDCCPICELHVRHLLCSETRTGNMFSFSTAMKLEFLRLVGPAPLSTKLVPRVQQSSIHPINLVLIIFIFLSEIFQFKAEKLKSKKVNFLENF